MGSQLEDLEKDFDQKRERLTAATARREALMGGAGQLIPGREVTGISAELSAAMDAEHKAQAEYEKARDAFYAARG